jgi:hypothetical protein
MRCLLTILLAAPLLAQDGQQAGQQAAPPAQAVPAATPAPAPAAKAESPAPATEDWLTGSIDLGFRWVSGIGGSVPTYRTVVNQRQDFELFGTEFTIQDPKHRWFDRIDANGYGWGSEPYNTAHVDARKLGIYDFTFDYRNIAYFNAEPSFANPFAPLGFNQQSFDTRIRSLSTELDLHTGKNIVPYLAFDHNSQNGSGIDTWVLGATNQFPVPALFSESTENYRAGVRFEYSKFHVTLEQGGTTFKNDDESTNNILNYGDLTTPILGQSISLNSLSEFYGIRGDAIYSRGLVTATPYSWLTLSGQFLFSQPRVDVHFTDNAAGNLLLLSELLFYSGQTDLATGTAKQPHVTSSAGGEIRPFRRMRIIESWMTDRFHDAAMGILATVYFATPPAVPPAPQTTISPETQIVNYNQNEVNAIYEVTKRITLRGGYRHVWGNAAVTAGVLSETGPFATGNLDRNVALAGATFRPWDKLRLHLDYEGASSDQVYFHTSLNDYQKGEARAQYQVTPTLSLTANFFALSNRNPNPEVNWYFLSRDNSLGVYWTPHNSKRFSFVGEYDRATERSNIIYLVPSTLSPALSIYRDNAHIVSSSVNVALPGYSGLAPTLTFGGSAFISSGSLPTTFYEPLARLSVPFTKKIAWRTEWRWYGLGETFYMYEGFRAHTLTTGLHLTR